jgi:hypothetical protein
MPLPWLFNEWGCNPFSPEPERDVAVDSRQFGGSRPPSLADVLNPPAPVKDPADYSTDDWYDTLTVDWQPVPNVIPDEKHVYREDAEAVRNFVNRHRAPDKQKTSLQCFDYANYQIHVQEFRPSGPAALSEDTLMVVHEYRESGGVRSEVQVFATVEAVGYLKAALLEGTPVLVGLRLNDWDARPNERKSTPFVEPTNHFVVVVGMGDDTNGKYFSFFDYSHAQRDEDRLYLRPSLLIMSNDDWLTLTEVRHSYPR